MTASPRPARPRPTWGCAAILLLPLPFFLAHPAFNNWKLQRLAASFDAVRHPASTLHIKSVQDFGNLSGTGNHCDYFVGEMRSYTGSRQSIRSFYSRVKVWDPVSFSSRPVEVEFMDSSLIDNEQSWLVWLDDVNNWGIVDIDDQKKLYVVCFLNGHDPGCDLRCT